ncbi:MAG: 1-deoxy-D-xylulose-5-phosphate synthase N-terminal domain-containing protein, partial [Methylococcaceae bacterium]
MNNSGSYPILDSITSPKELRLLPKEQLKPLAKELREFLTQSVSISGGHFSAGLGTVELTVALHYV